MTIDISPSTIYLITGSNRPRGIGTAYRVITEKLLPNLPLISKQLGFGLVTQADWLVAFPMSPGGVSTDMVTDACNDDLVFKSLVSGAEPTTAEAAVSILKVIDEATREKKGGEFMHLDGTKIPSW